MVIVKKMSLSLKSLPLNKRNVDRHFMKRGLPKGNTFMKCWVKQNETNAFIIRFLKVFTILTSVVNFLEGSSLVIQWIRIFISMQEMWV